MNRISRKIITVAAILSVLILTISLATAQIAWVKDFDSALKQAAKEEKFIFLDLSASW